MRKRIYEIIEVASGEDKASRVYDIFMMIVIVISLVPLMFYEQSAFLHFVDIGSGVIFLIDYLLRLLTADYKLKKGKASFIIYPFTPMAIIDFVALLSAFEVLSIGFRLLKIIRLMRSFRVLKALRYSKNLVIILNVVKNQKKALATVCGLAVGYVFLSALILFNVEPETFSYTFFNALYWSTVSLTTMGYGDISPVSELGRLFTMLSSLAGIAVIALPSGIMTAGYLNEISKTESKKNDLDEKKDSSTDL